MHASSPSRRHARHDGRAFLRDWRDDHLRVSDDLEEMLGEAFVLAVTTAEREEHETHDAIEEAFSYQSDYT